MSDDRPMCSYWMPNKGRTCQRRAKPDLDRCHFHPRESFPDHLGAAAADDPLGKTIDDLLDNIGVIKVNIDAVNDPAAAKRTAEFVETLTRARRRDFDFNQQAGHVITREALADIEQALAEGLEAELGEPFWRRSSAQWNVPLDTIKDAMLTAITRVEDRLLAAKRRHGLA